MTDAHGTADGPRGPVVVVGGGVIGLCLAHHLAEGGAQVDVVERHHVGAGASWGNAGWVCESHSAPIPAPGVVRDALASLGQPGLTAVPATVRRPLVRELDVAVLAQHVPATVRCGRTARSRS